MTKKNNLIELLERSKLHNNYTRINEEYKHNMYIGYNAKNNISFVVNSLNFPKDIESSQIINVNAYKRSDSTYNLEFELTDKIYAASFLKLCEDLIETSEPLSEEYVIRNISSRWKIWKSMMKNGKMDILSKNQIKGLIGELLFLYHYMFEKYSIKESLFSWQGVEFLPKDYAINDTWYEIKTTSPSSNVVKISSLEQLDSNHIGNLVVISLQDSNPEVNDSLTLNSLVDFIENNFDEYHEIELFKNKLASVGYFRDEKYNEMHFEYIETKLYTVNDEFPRISRSLLQNEIMNAKYDIDLTSLEPKEIIKWK